MRSSPEPGPVTPVTASRSSPAPHRAPPHSRGGGIVSTGYLHQVPHRRDRGAVDHVAQPRVTVRAGDEQVGVAARGRCGAISCLASPWPSTRARRDAARAELARDALERGVVLAALGVQALLAEVAARGALDHVHAAPARPRARTCSVRRNSQHARRRRRPARAPRRCAGARGCRTRACAAVDLRGAAAASRSRARAGAVPRHAAAASGSAARARAAT